MSHWFTTTVGNGSMLLAIPVALVAGLLSFLSPCVIPMLPGYLSYATGLSGADLATGEVRRTRMLFGSVLFVLGFSVVFVTLGVAAGSVSVALARWEHTYGNLVLGVITIVLGLAFLGMVPWLQRDMRVHKIPAVGLAAAPVLGFLFGLGWTPCIGPTLAAITSLAVTSGNGTRGGVLLGAYSLGMGLPFIAAAVMWRQALHGLGWLRKRQQIVSRVGGILLIVVGVALLTGWWEWSVQWLQIHVVNQWQGVSV